MPDNFPTTYEFGSYRVSSSERVLTRGGAPVALTPKAVDTLLVLLEHHGHIVTRDQLMKAVWPDTYVGDDSLTRNISALRKIFDDAVLSIETLSKRGYRLSGAVRAVSNGKAPSAAAAQAIAVMPFETLTAAEEEAYLASGIADALVSRLTKVPGLLIRPMSAVLRYAGSPDDTAAIRSQLRVNLVLSGSIRRDRDRIRVSAQLVNVDADAVAWAETFSAAFTDLFTLEDAIAAQVADAVMPRVYATLPAPVHRPLNPAAYETYLRGRHAWNRGSAESYKTALDHYLQALAIDPSYAPAHAGVADCYNMMGFWWLMPPRDAFPRAEQFARRALELDASLGDAHVSLAWARLHYHYDRQGAEALFQRALQLNPGYVTAHQWYALFFAQDGQFDRAFEQIHAALAIDPRALAVNYNVGVFLMLTRRFDAAIEQFQRTLDIDAAYGMAHGHMALSYALKGMAAEAFAANDRAAAFSAPAVTLTSAALLHAVLGNHGAALETLAEFERVRGDAYILPIMVGQVYAALGDADRAMIYLEQDYDIRDNWLMWVKVNPCFDPIRTDARLTALLARIGLQP
jgi:TolB-like protein/Tfp pilus assembly protein PilF